MIKAAPTPVLGPHLFIEILQNICKMIQEMIPGVRNPGVKVKEVAE